jgi:hypothetical protein
MNDRHLILLFPHLLSEDRQLLEREQMLRNAIREARLEAREKARAERKSRLERLRLALTPRRGAGANVASAEQ